MCTHPKAHVSWEKAELTGLVNFKTFLKPGFRSVGWNVSMTEGKGGHALQESKLDVWPCVDMPGKIKAQW